MQEVMDRIGLMEKIGEKYFRTYKIAVEALYCQLTRVDAIRLQAGGTD
ncbi:MAG: hypothetical protein WC091_24480 [Sulfuricellaceae bacterium]